MDNTQELAKRLRPLTVEAEKIGLGWQRVDDKTIYSVYPFGKDYLIAKFEDSSCAEFCATANPVNIIALLDEREALRAEIAALHSAMAGLQDMESKASKQIMEFESFITKCSGMEGGMVNGNRLSIAANVVLGFGEVIGRQCATNNIEATKRETWKLQFLTDVVTAAGLVSHGAQDKELAKRVSTDAMRWREELFSTSRAFSK